MTAITGFGALPSKPDFAFPKTVSKDAGSRLKSALKHNDGPATVRALLDYGLAQTAISPDKLDATMDFFDKTGEKVTDPATKAMIRLAQADARRSDSLTVATIAEYDSALKAAPTADWRNVVDADERFFPTLYDFAVARTDNDSVVNAAMRYNAGRPYPLIYLKLRNARNFGQYLDVYRQFESSEVATYALLEMARSAWDIDMRRQAYDLLLKRTDRNAGVKDALSYLTRPEIRIEANSVVARDALLKIKVHATCLNAAAIKVSMEKPAAQTVKTINLTFKGEGVFEADTVVELQLDRYGKYRLTPLYDGMNERRPDYATLTVTDFLLSQPNFGGSRLPVAALDVINGAEQSDVRFQTVKNRIAGHRGNDIYTPEIYSYSGNESRPDWHHQANILTDRAIYHPGDTLRFAATLMKSRATERGLEPGRKVDAVLRNANYQPIDTLTLVSDDYGRVEGSFTLPADGLTGRFTLKIGDSYAYVMVTDYKAPTFAVEMTATRIDSTSVELDGTATGYNGFPIANAQVALTVDELPMWIWFRNFRNFRGNDRVATDTVTTDAQGRFTARLTIPAGVNLSATATATSPAGESHDAAAFIPFYRYHIEGDIPPFIEAGKAPKLTVQDVKGKTVDIPVRITLTRTGDDTRLTPDATWSNIPSGAYSVELSADQAATGKSTTQVYRRTDAMPPAESALFVPVTNAKPGDRLLVGTSFADSHILMVIWNADSIIEQRRLTPKQGNFFLDIDLPDGVNDANMTLLTLRDYRFREMNIRLTRPDVARKLNLEIASLRDKVTPGDREIWTIKVTDNLGRPAADAAVMLDVYCKALDALQPFSWGFNPPYLYGKSLGFNNGSSYLAGAANATAANLPRPLAGISAGFNLWGQDWPYFHERYYYNTAAPRMLMKSAARADFGGVVEECSAVSADVDNDAAADEILEESAVTAGGTGNDSGTAAADGNDTYRLPEMAVAMWRPVLTTAADGSLQVEFEVPDANTTWAVKALAYNRLLMSGTTGAEIVASKPVMVQPQLPRFLRNGDRIELRAMVMNNVDSAAAISSFIELFDPATDRIIRRAEFTDQIDARESKIIAMELTAPDATMIGVRVRATAGNFTDGEQSVIPVLPNEVTVRTGRPIFVPADSATVEVDVPKGGVMTFTANAVWECVAALPGLLTSESRSALSAASTLFSAATARGLMRQHPEIGLALHRWEKEDSVLISRLLRNDDLKIALLGSTPFVNAAQSETDQRARLLLLFSNSQIDKTVNDAISTLSKLVRKGGLTWTQSSDEPSEWITLRVMQTLGQLKRMGYLPKSSTLQKIISQGVQYLDTEVARSYAKDKNATFVDYVMMRSQFPEVRQSAPARRAADATVQHLVGRWRDMPLRSVAKAAIILHENKYPTTARRLIESLRQHEAWLQLPLCPDLLNAFVAVEPACPEVDMIRSEYIARKQSTDWGQGLATSDLIAAILNSGSPWLIPAANELGVKVNGNTVDPAAESVMGEFRLDLPDGGKVEIAKGRFPAWGGIFSSAVDSISKVEAFASDKLKLTRTISGTMKVGEKVTVTLTLDAAQDLDYVIVRQPRCAAMEPVDQLPSTLWLGYLTAYREPCPTVTNWFFNRLAKGKTTISETFYITAEGDFTLAPAEAQSQYSPEFQAHTAGSPIAIPKN